MGVLMGKDPLQNSITPSRIFQLPLTTAVSAAMLALAGCNDGVTVNQSTQYCVGQENVRVDDSFCTPANNRGGFYRWYYVSGGGRVPYVGGHAGGGRYVPSSGSSYSSAPASASGTVRGGFGASAGEGGAGE